MSSGKAVAWEQGKMEVVGAADRKEGNIVVEVCTGWNDLVVVREQNIEFGVERSRDWDDLVVQG